MIPAQTPNGKRLADKLFVDKCTSVHEAWEEWKTGIKDKYAEYLKHGDKYILGTVNNKAMSRNAPLLLLIESYIHKTATEQYAVAYFEQLRVRHKMPLGVFRNAARIVYSILQSMDNVTLSQKRFRQSCKVDLHNGWQTPIRGAVVSIGLFCESLTEYLSAMGISIFTLRQHVENLQYKSHKATI